MSWDEREFAGEPGLELPAMVEQLVTEQLEAWVPLRTGVESLSRARFRKLSIGSYGVTALHIPHRIRSTTAATDADAVRGRPCFLCEANLPRVQRGIRFGPQYMILCNPFPILENHLTIVGREHVPQRLSGAVSSMLELAKALIGYLVLYNGADCGASAPDHIHFQACRPSVPIIEDSKLAVGGLIPDYSRTAVVLEGVDPRSLEAVLEKFLGGLHEIDRSRLEPMVNVVAFYEGDRWKLIVFPRARHRPDVFYTGDLTWSPGAIDLCGVIVLPVEGDLERVTPEAIETGFDQVSLAATSIEGLVRKLGSG